MKTTKQILNSYPFSRRFCVLFTLKLCNEIKDLITKDPKALYALELTQKWYDGDLSVTAEMLIDAAYAAHWALKAKPKHKDWSKSKDWTKEILTNMIKTELNEFEQIMLGIKEE